jgi:hypothetical protein
MSPASPPSRSLLPPPFPDIPDVAVVEVVEVVGVIDVLAVVVGIFDRLGLFGLVNSL